MRKRKETSTTTEQVFISPWNDEMFQEDYDMLTDTEFDKGTPSFVSSHIV